MCPEPACDPLNTSLYSKESEFLKRVADSGSGAGNIQDDPGIFFMLES